MITDIITKHPLLFSVPRMRILRYVWQDPALPPWPEHWQHSAATYVGRGHPWGRPDRGGPLRYVQGFLPWSTGNELFESFAKGFLGETAEILFHVFRQMVSASEVDMEQTSANWMRLEYSSDTAALRWHWHTTFFVNSHYHCITANRIDPIRPPFTFNCSQAPS